MDTSMTVLTGTWRLVRAQAWDGDGKPVAPPYDGKGLGRIVFSADGRMAVMMIDGRTTVPAGERREYSGYCGTYSFDGKQLVTHVDAAPDPSRIGELMVLRPPARTQGGKVEQRELTWERISSV
jgi:hypothetical protein